MEDNTRDDTYVQFVKLSDDAIIPKRGTEYSAGFDLYATEDITVVGGGGTKLVSTGIGIRLPQGTYGRIAMRSGLARDHHLTVSGGVVDSDYIGEIKVLVSCTKMITKYDKNSKSYGCFGGEFDTPDGKYVIQPHVYTIRKGERFAQLVIEKINTCSGNQATMVLHMHSAPLPRHDGFGSTGKM